MFFTNKWQKMSLFSLVQTPTFVMSTEATDLIQALMKRAMAHRTTKIWQSFTLAFMFVCSFSTGLVAQGWEVTFGGNSEDFGFSILQTIDEGFVAAGYSESFGSDGDFDIYLVRTDVDGTLVWQYTYDEGYIEQANDIIQLPDGSFLVIGKANDVDGTAAGTPSQVYLMRINARGGLVWSRRYGNNGLAQSGRKIIRTTDGGYMVIGSTQRTVGGDNDILLLKLDSNADEVWREVYGTPYTDAGQGIVEVPGGYVFAANVKDGQSSDNDVAIYRVNNTGGLVSLNVYGDLSDNEDVSDLIKTQDGNVLLVGSSDNFNNAYIIKSDFNGDTLWTREITVGPFGNELKAVIEQEDGSIVATGLTARNTSTLSILLLKMTADGDVIWQRSLGEEFSDNRFGEGIAQAADGGLVITGYSSQSGQVFINDLTIVKVDGEGNYFTNVLRGKVFWSQNGCNPFEAGDLLLANWLVQVEGEGTRFIGTTDANGNYLIPVDIGSYTVTLLPKNDAWDVCSPASLPVDFTTAYDTLVYNFPVRSAATSCANLNVEASTGILTSCSTVQYLFEYCNDGSATASDAYVEIILDDELTFLSASVDTSLETANSIIVRLGDLAPLTCGSFTITVQVACDGIQNLQAVTVDTRIYPVAYCAEPDPNWDRSSIEVTGRCVGNEVIFTAKNAGDAPSDGTQSYVIVEDVLLFIQDVVPPLGPGQEVPLGNPIPANEMGSTYRLIVEQAEGHPGNNYPTVAVEGCHQTDNENYTTGSVTQFPENDQDPYIDIDVQEIFNTSGTANLLIGHPKGYLDSIITANTDIEYTVLFANTGSDTLNRLVIRDTLPAALDFGSLAIGPASHPYDFELYNGGILKITFNDLNLVPIDGGTSEADSRGFVKFSLSQKPNLPLGTIFENSAAVYFDYIAPEVTNTVRHVLDCENFLTNGCLTVEVQEPPVSAGINIRVQPNPFHSAAIFTIDGCECQRVEMIVRDALGRQVRREQFAGPTFTFQRNELVPALYFFEIYNGNQIVQAGKLLVQ
jgi:uncharacterized repeat protein (TIGR01451 family)